MQVLVIASWPVWCIHFSILYQTPEEKPCRKEIKENKKQKNEINQWNRESQFKSRFFSSSSLFMLRNFQNKKRNVKK